MKFLSVTPDSLFDTPGVLKSYAHGYNLDESNFRLGTAGKKVIDDLTRQFGIMRKKNQIFLSTTPCVLWSLIPGGKLSIRFPEKAGRSKIS